MSFLIIAISANLLICKTCFLLCSKKIISSMFFLLEVFSGSLPTFFDPLLNTLSAQKSENIRNWGTNIFGTLFPKNFVLLNFFCSKSLLHTVLTLQYSMYFLSILLLNKSFFWPTFLSSSPFLLHTHSIQN